MNEGLDHHCLFSFCLKLTIREVGSFSQIRMSIECLEGLKIIFERIFLLFAYSIFSNKRNNINSPHSRGARKHSLFFLIVFYCWRKHGCASRSKSFLLSNIIFKSRVSEQKQTENGHWKWNNRTGQWTSRLPFQFGRFLSDLPKSRTAWTIVRPVSRPDKMSWFLTHRSFRYLKWLIRLQTDLQQMTKKSWMGLKSFTF